MKRLGTCTVVLSLMLFTCAFTEPVCENINPILRTEPYEEEVYKIELARLIKAANPNDLKFYLSGYIRPGDNEFLIVSIHGADFCAKAAIQVDDWQKLQDIRRTSARGYRGAELQEFKITIKEDAGKIAFVYKDIEAVVE